MELQDVWRDVQTQLGQRARVELAKYDNLTWAGREELTTSAVKLYSWNVVRTLVFCRTQVVTQETVPSMRLCELLGVVFSGLERSQAMTFASWWFHVSG